MLTCLGKWTAIPRCFWLVSIVFIAVVYSQGGVNQVEDVTWQQSKESTIKLGVRDKGGSLGSYTAVFVVTGPDKKKYTASRKVNGDDFEYVSFPGDFGESLPSVGGLYTVECTVKGQVVTRDKFRWTHPGEFLR
jgi:hypothetical protein